MGCNKYVDPDDPMLLSIGGVYHPLSPEERCATRESFPAYAGYLATSHTWVREMMLYKNEAGYRLAFGTDSRSGKNCWFLWDGTKSHTTPDIWTCPSLLPTPPSRGAWTKLQNELIDI